MCQHAAVDRGRNEPGLFRPRSTAALKHARFLGRHICVLAKQNHESAGAAVPQPKISADDFQRKGTKSAKVRFSLRSSFLCVVNKMRATRRL